MEKDLITDRCVTFANFVKEEITIY